MTAEALVRVGQFNQAARQAAYIFIALALPRLGVPTDRIGEWESLLFVGFVLGFGWTTGLLQGFLVRIGDLSGIHAEWFSRRAVRFTMLLSVAVLLLAALFHDPFFRLLQFGGAPAGWHLFFLLLLSRWPSYCFEQALLLTDKARMLTAYTLLNTGGLITALLLPLYLGYDFNGALRFLGGYAGAKTAAIAVWTLLLPAGEGVRPAHEDIRRWLVVSRPLMAYSTVAALVSIADPWVVNFWSGGDEEIFAIFRYGVRELPMLAALISGMTVVTLPAITRKTEDGLTLLQSQSRRLFHYVFALALLLMLTGEYWWTMVFTPAFADSLPIFRTYLLVVGCRMIFAMTVLTALNETKRLYLLGLLELAVNVALSLLLAPRYGLLGIIWGTVIASYFHEACLIGYLYHRRRIGWRDYADLRWYGLYLVALFVAYLLV